MPVFSGPGLAISQYLGTTETANLYKRFDVYLWSKIGSIDQENYRRRKNEMKIRTLLSVAAVTLMATSAFAHTANCTLKVNGESQSLKKKLIVDTDGSETTSNVGGVPQIGNYICYGSISLLGKATSYRVYLADVSAAKKDSVISQTTGITGQTDGRTDIELDAQSKMGEQIRCSCQILN